ncbi:LysE family translocator [Sphingomonas sp. CFBP 8765]|uniref:LysE family translocator n=1 Tax=Sphingomonas sp. CFBP 8765 TaxID=2775274 RepID=UPI00177D8222|nr:LysE family translocator [Sphingomonas sp. CFBP 8765]MBD8472053.1 LysE family translocator [Sphingomonas sp. CFBP 8765]
MHELLLVYTAYVIAAASPGPSNMAIMNVGMGQGRRPALALAAGVITMSFCWGLIAATGLSALLARYAEALVILKIIGGLYLLWLALRSARSALRSNDAATAMPRVRQSMGALYRRGLLMHLGNPKSVMAWLAIMTLGVGAEASSGRVAAAFLGCVALAVVVFGGYALLFSTPLMVRGYARLRRWIEGALAMVFTGAGIRLLTIR